MKYLSSSHVPSFNVTNITETEVIFGNGALVLDRSRPNLKPRSDFMLGAEMEVTP